MSQQTQMDFSGIYDNLERGSVANFLKKKIEPGATLSIVSAYFTIYAYAGLRDQLDSIANLRFLFGEPRFISTLDPEKTDKKAFRIEDMGLELKNRLRQKEAAKTCAQWITDKVDIRSMRQSNLLHGKMYHIDNHRLQEAIIGSSNFTVRGLGMSEARNNIELNLEVQDRRDKNDLKTWFDELWHNEDLVEDVKAEVLAYLEQLYQNNPPEFIYFKTLFHLFEQFLADQDKSGLLTEHHHIVNTAIWQALFEFQKDGVKGAINKLLTYGGCIIADSVGLGKTYEALAIIKYFQERNHNILVLCPKKLRENWTIYTTEANSTLNPFIKDRFAYRVLSHTDLSRDRGQVGSVDLANFHWNNFDLVVIDESHNFRNNTRGRRDEEGQVIRKSRYERLMEDIIQSGRKTKVLLLSATPVNNDLSDLRNQINFITEDDKTAFASSMGIANFADTLAGAQKTFNEWASKPQRDRRVLLNRLNADFFKLLDELTIARSRSHIYRYYSETVEALGGFPARNKPKSIFPDIDVDNKFMSYDRLFDEISEYKLAMFMPGYYVLPQHQARYIESGSAVPFTQKQREFSLAGMMRVNFLKRLESSIAAFRITLARTIEKIDGLLAQIEAFHAHTAANDDFDLDDLRFEALEDEELAEALFVGKRFLYNLNHLDLAEWEKDLRLDRARIETIHSHAKRITLSRDMKLKELKKLIKQKVQNPTETKQGQANRKVLVFTAFADTATYLYGALSGWATDLGIHSALVTGSGPNETTLGRTDFNDILTNFAPLAKKRGQMTHMPQAAEIDLLIATDCISEGQNLQDCDYLINYDIHWNPVRIIQRFGRIDRIGSQNTSVQLVNFWPTPDLNKYIDLKSRVEARMALVDVTATAEDNVLSPEQLEDLIESDLTYRDKQLLRLQEEILDLEDFNETVALSDFTLDDFRIELLKYLEANRQQLQDAPDGLYAVVPPPPAQRLIEPGVIFCLKQKGPRVESKQVNPLHPYFLVYVAHKERQLVRFGFAQPKQILEIYRQLCLGKTEVYEDLCRLFDASTQDGAEMSRYTPLLEIALASIKKTHTRRVASALTSSGRGGLLLDQSQQVTDKTEFELVTWLVIE